MNNYLKKSLIFFTSFLIFTSNSNHVRAELIDNEMANAYAEFIEALQLNISVPKQGKLCIFGNDEISEAIFLRNNNVEKIDDKFKNINNCNFVYIAHNKQKAFKFFGKKFIDNKVFTIANYEGFASSEYGMIEIRFGRRNFEIILNKKIIKNNNIKINSLVSNLIIN